MKEVKEHNFKGAQLSISVSHRKESCCRYFSTIAHKHGKPADQATPWATRRLTAIAISTHERFAEHTMFLALSSRPPKSWCPRDKSIRQFDVASSVSRGGGHGENSKPCHGLAFVSEQPFTDSQASLNTWQQPRQGTRCSCRGTSRQL